QPWPLSRGRRDERAYGDYRASGSLCYSNRPESLKRNRPISFPLERSSTREIRVPLTNSAVATPRFSAGSLIQIDASSPFLISQLRPVQTNDVVVCGTGVQNGIVLLSGSDTLMSIRSPLPPPEAA